VNAAQGKVDFKAVLDEVLAAAKEGFTRSNWNIGESYDQIIRPFLGNLTIRAAQKLGMDMPPSPDVVRKEVAEELREQAARHPVGAVRRALLDAADRAEMGHR